MNTMLRMFLAGLLLLTGLASTVPAGELEFRRLAGHEQGVDALAFSADGKILASGSGVHEKYGEVKIWDVAGGVELTTRKLHRSTVSRLLFSPDDRRLITGSNDATIQSWEWKRGMEPVTLAKLPGAVWSMGLSGDGKTLAAGLYSGQVALYDLAGDRELGSFKASQLSIRALTWIGKETTLVTGGSSMLDRPSPPQFIHASFQVWDAAQKKETRFQPAAGRHVLALAATSDGRLLASATEFGIVQIWDVASGQELREFQAHEALVHGMQFSPNGKILATAGYREKCVTLWDVATWEEVARLTGHPREVIALAFSPDGATLTTACREIRLWNVSGVVNGRAARR